MTAVTGHSPGRSNTIYENPNEISTRSSEDRRGSSWERDKQGTVLHRQGFGPLALTRHGMRTVPRPGSTNTVRVGIGFGTWSGRVKF
jgi:hypothetical protein